MFDSKNIDDCDKTLYQYNSNIYRLYFRGKLGPAFNCSIGRPTATVEPTNDLWSYCIFNR